MEKRFIDESIRIRKEYIKNLKHINSKQEIIIKYSAEMDKTKLILEDIDLTDMSNKQQINDALITLEKNINDIINEILPYQNKIEELKKQTSILYASIKEKYENITDTEIENEILPYIQNII